MLGQSSVDPKAMQRNKKLPGCCLMLAGLCAAAKGAPPSDPDFALQWGLHNTGQSINGSLGVPGADIGALDAWDMHTGGTPVTVAIIASGVNVHPEFAGRLLEGMAFGANVDPYDSRDAGWVGTHMAGVIAAAHEGVGIAGIHPHVRVLPMRVVGTNAAAYVAVAIRAAAAREADIIVVAHQFPGDNALLQEAVEYANAQGILLVAPAGHDGESQVAYPARYPECIAVASAGMADQSPSWANRGAEVELAAPGEHIWSTLPNGGYGYESAESSALAAAYVAGAASLVWSYFPSLTATQVRQLLVDTAVDLGAAGPDPFFGFGRVNMGAALAALSPAPPRFDFTWNLPEFLPPGQSLIRHIRIEGGFRTIAPQTAKLIYRIPPAGVGTPIALQWHGGSDYSIHFPPVACGASMEYYLSAVAQGGFVLTYPSAAPLDLRVAKSVAFNTLLEDDFENDLGWETSALGTDTAGQWTRVVPVGTALSNPSLAVQPAHDRTPNAGLKCFVTGQYFGNDAGSSDVDGGPVQLLSPIMPLSTQDAEVRYARWFVSQTGTPDILRVEFTRDAGLTWTVAEEVSSTGGWEYHEFRLSEFGPAAGNQLRLRFTTSDQPNDSLTEAAIDDVRVRAITCDRIAGDANGDGWLDILDWSAWAGCLTGPGAAIGQDCWAVDLISDGRADLRDAAEFQKLVYIVP